ncbi:MAG TPA: tyrosine-type recombinase/integrase [Solirubrobacteraceae bacterium]|jgi:integrase|nr:tyrosine-type recombinase/integrase [Solirubrobacteraceae bacterium]
MPRPAKGQVVLDKRPKSPTFALRFRVDGQREYKRLGSVDEGWDRAKAEAELDKVLAEVRLGIRRPAEPEAIPDVQSDPTFREFSSQWFEAGEGSWRPKTREDYEWQLSHHLLPFFQHHPLSRITIAEVDRYRTAKVKESAKLAKAQEGWRKHVDEANDRKHRRELVRERPPRPLSAGSINKTLITLSQVLEVAAEYGLIERNPAKGKRRRLKATKPPAVWLDRAEHVHALLDAAGELDREAPPERRHIERRALLSVLVFAGLRIGELTELRWRDVDLSGGKITVRASKTDAGLRTIDVLPVLHDTLAALKAARNPSLQDRVFPTTTGEAQNPSNIRQRVLAPAVKRANAHLEKAGETPLPEPITPHKLRHTYASLLVALGTDPGAAMDQLGHTDPGFTLRVYRHGMRRDATTKQGLRELVGLAEGQDVWAAMGSSAAPVTSDASWAGG